MYRLGQLNRRIHLERDTRVPDGLGGVQLQPVIYAHLWAYYRQKSTRELLLHQRSESQSGGVFVIRNRKDIFPSDRLVCNGVAFNIVGFPPYNPRDAFLEIDVDMGVAN